MWRVIITLCGSKVSFGPEAVTQFHASVKRRVGESTRLLCHRHMALPVPTYQHIQPMFNRLKYGSCKKCSVWTTKLKWLKSTLLIRVFFTKSQMNYRPKNSYEMRQSWSATKISCGWTGNTPRHLCYVIVTIILALFLLLYVILTHRLLLLLLFAFLGLLLFILLQNAPLLVNDWHDARQLLRT